MEANNIRGLVETLKTAKTKQTICTNLTKLVSILKEKGKYSAVLKHGGIRIAIHYLNQKNNSIIDISLSLLANCCQERDCATEVIRCNGIKIILKILNTNKRDSILCRACRLVGNIARFDTYAAAFYNHGTVPVIINILNRSTTETNEIEQNEKLSVDTQAMAVRVLRTLWKQTSQKKNMRNDGAIRAVSIVLTQHTEIWLKLDPEKRVRKQSFLRNVLECLLLFSKHKNKDCVEQISAEGFKALVSLMTLYPYNCVKCLTNLSAVATSRTEIANASAVKCIINMTNKYLNENPDAPYPSELIGALSLFCKHPMNCLELKNADGLQLMLKLLKNCKSQRHEYILIRSINQFRTDKGALDILVANDLVNIYIGRLEKHLKIVDLVNNEHEYSAKLPIPALKRSRRNSSSGESSSEESDRSDSAVSNSPTEHSAASSPKYSRVTSESEASPSSSPNCTPPRESEMEDDDDDNSENYSPVCSDLEDEEETDTTTEPKDQADDTAEPDEPDAESSDGSFNPSGVRDSLLMQRSKYMMILLLLHTMNRDTPPLDLSTCRAIIVLLKYVKESNETEENIKRLVNRILVTAHYRPQILKSGIMATIYKVNRYPHDLNCTVCEKIHVNNRRYLNSIVVMKQNVRDVTNFQDLLRNMTEDEKKMGVLSTSLLVCPNATLFKIFQKTDCLSVFIKLFPEKPYFRPHIAQTLYRMSRNINLKNPASSSPEPTPKVKKFKIPMEYELDPDVENTVTIKFDDRRTLKVDRDFLISQSDYFKTLLTGSFKEKNADVIRVKKIPSRAFRTLLNILKFDCPSMGPTRLDLSINTILDVVVLADIYLMEKVLSWLTQCVELYFINKTSASDIYNWALKSSTGYFRGEVIAYILTEEMSPEDRAKILEKVNARGHFEQLTIDIMSLMGRFASMYKYY